MAKKRATPEKAASERFGVNLRKLRERHRLTAKDIAEVIGLRTDTILKYERGEREPSILTLIALSQYFGISMDLLVIGEKQPKGMMNFLSGDQLKNFIVIRDCDSNITYIGPDRRRQFKKNFSGKDKRKK
ncbi:MAG: helix-turn-helix domain-containing protein [Rhodospirillaceae bacterium]|jgi:transcriptional regulator with XRE-family HTH domain